LAQLVDAQVAQVRDQPHEGVDLAFEGIDGGTAVGAQLAGIVHFADGIATVGWAYEARDLGTFSVIGKAPSQQLAFEHTEWITPADAECCGVRTFRFVVAKTADGYYSVVSDNRSWLGAWVLSPYTTNQVGAEVLAISPNSPAAKTLKPGDVIESVAGTPARSGLLSSAIIDEIAAHTSGSVVTLNVERGGKPMQVRVKLGSRDEQAAIVAPPPDPGYLGMSGVTMTEQLAAENSLPNVRGVAVTNAASGTAAAAAGLQAGDIIVDIGGYQITSLGSLDLPLVQIGANSTTSLQFITPQGVQRTVSVTLATPPLYGSEVEDLAFL
jgi:membrane-associated protease RseP (regulator of RpoE activity)